MPNRKRMIVRTLITVIAIVAVIGIIIGISNRGRYEEIETYEITRGTIREEVEVSGRVVPQTEVTLGFENGGKVSNVYVDVGDTVSKGQLLASQDTQVLQAQINEAQATIEVEEARLAELQDGTRPEEIEIKQRELELAQQQQLDAYRSAAIEARNAYTNANDIVHNKVDSFFTDGRSTNPKLSFTLATDQGLQNQIEADRRSIETLLTQWGEQINAHTDLETPTSLEILNQSEANLVRINQFVDDAALVVNTVQATLDLTQTTIDSWKTSISTGRTTLATTFSSVQTKRESVSNQMLNVNRIQDELQLLINGATEAQLNQIRAQIRAAEASVSTLNAQLRQRRIFSPVKGVVTTRSVEPGEIVPTQHNVLTIIADAGFQIEANIPEIDIAKITSESAASTTIDALPGENFAISVSQIDPAETEIDGVATYQVEFVFDEKDDRIKSGMTTNLFIVTQEIDDALFVPLRFTDTDDEGRYVMTKSGSEEQEKIYITTGLVGTDGLIEILEGVNEEDIIVDPGI